MGSSSIITNLAGAVEQHLEYIPYGEVFIDQRLGTTKWNTPYKFNAKELDEETGLYYYGARYLDPRSSLWISVDPLAEKYAGMSPYAYCLNNPVKYVDPDGRFSTKFGAWLYKSFNGGGETLQDKSSGEFYVHNQVKGDATATATRRFDWSGRNQGNSSNTESTLTKVLNWEGGDTYYDGIVGIPKSDFVAVANGLEVVSNVSDGLGVASLATPVTAPAAPYLLGAGKVAGSLSDGINVGIDFYDGKYKNAIIGVVGIAAGEILPPFIKTGNASIDKVTGVEVDKAIDIITNESKDK